MYSNHEALRQLEAEKRSHVAYAWRHRRRGELGLFIYEWSQVKQCRRMISNVKAAIARGEA
jgi:hypothetical protein